MPGLGGLDALAAVLGADGFELLVQRQLLGQPLAQFGVVVDDQDLARIGHSVGPPQPLCRAGRREVERTRYKSNRKLGIGDQTMGRTALRFIRVSTRPGRKSQGWLFAGPLSVPVALGRTGIRADKREGDGGTPRGRFRPLRLWWR